MVIGIIVQVYVDFFIQESIGGQYYGMVGEMDIGLGDCVDDVVVFQYQVIYCLLEQLQVGLVFQV